MKKTKEKSADRQDLALQIVKYGVMGLAFLYLLFVAFGRFIPVLSAAEFYGHLDIFTERAVFNKWLRSLSYVLCILSISAFLRHVLQFAFIPLKRGRSIISLTGSFIKYVAVVVLIFCVLACFGVDTAALIAGIGILSLIVGLAIQPLLQDVIAGLFVVFEKTYDVGDVLVVDGFRGTVIEIGIRTTKIKDAGGDIKVINNSDVRTLVNMTGDLSTAISDIDIEYGESLERVEKIIEANLGTIREKIPEILNGPFYKGVEALGASGVKLRFVAKCKEDCKYQVQRDLNRQLKLLFDANGINVPFTQIVVHDGDKKPQVSASSGETEKFIKEQKTLSRGIEEDDNKF